MAELNALRELFARGVKAYFTTEFIPFASNPESGVDNRICEYTDRNDPDNVREWMSMKILLVDVQSGDMVKVPFLFSKYEAQEFIRQFQKLMSDNGWSEE